MKTKKFYSNWLGIVGILLVLILIILLRITVKCNGPNIHWLIPTLFLSFGVILLKFSIGIRRPMPSNLRATYFKRIGRASFIFIAISVGGSFLIKEITTCATFVLTLILSAIYLLGLFLFRPLLFGDIKNKLVSKRIKKVVTNLITSYKLSEISAQNIDTDKMEMGTLSYDELQICKNIIAHTKNLGFGWVEFRSTHVCGDLKDSSGATELKSLKGLGLIKDVHNEVVHISPYFVTDEFLAFFKSAIKPKKDWIYPGPAHRDEWE